jgi:hypothetical protein
VLLIDDRLELARILVALLVSIAFVALQLGIKPFRRCARTHAESACRNTYTRC